MAIDHGTSGINQTIVDFIDSGLSFAVALVLEAEGSTPRKAAVKAVIDETGKIYGTIGGGAVEAEAQQKAIEACRSGRPEIFEMVLHGANRAAGEPICGGMMRILIDPTAAKDRASYAAVAKAIRERKRGIMLTTVRTETATEVTTRRFLAETIPSDVPFPGADGISSCLERETPRLFVEPIGGASPTLQVLVEPVIAKPLLVIAGGGAGDRQAASCDRRRRAHRPGFGASGKSRWFRYHHR